MALTTSHNLSGLMAGNDLSRKLTQLRLAAAVKSMLSSVVIFAAICIAFDIDVFESNQKTGLSALVFGVILCKTYGLFSASKSIKAFSSGLKGETLIARELSKLPSDFLVLNHVLLPNSRSMTGFTEVDFLVVGRGGVHLIEVKNNGGEIFVEEGADQWKINANGKRFTMRNPVRQVSIQKRVLHEVLTSKGVDCPVSCSVVMSSPEAVLKGNLATSVPVCGYRKSYVRKAVVARDKDLAKLSQIDGKIADLILDIKASSSE